ncbi:MFS transporter [uncultured Kocuria sp.]|uniref:MFS transporter n=1 Tax=uncultured Kocuria sp. TaxID=259305 RepID=UPI00261AA9C8|nr:MFS transporter [uncultured Kocuria sp.]
MTTTPTTTQQSPPPSGPAVQESLNTKDMRRILASSFVGSAIEYYDFILYATAASLVFNHVFFANLDPAVALFASFATMAAGYLARPLGGIVFGHYGDRIGRKKMLVLSMLLMGGATVLIGLLPTTAQIGLAAPVILVLLRLVQGVAVGGEWGGAALMALEHAPQSKRGFATVFANAGGPAGAILATLVVSAVSALTGDQFLEWGWRIPFLLSAVLIVVGMVIRLKVTETPMFAQLTEVGEKRRLPLTDVLRNHPRAVVLALVAATSFYCCQGLLTVWGVSIAAAEGVDREALLNWKAAGAVVTLLVTFWAARMSDHIGRRKMLTIGGVMGIVAAYPLMLLLNNGTLWGFAVAIIIGQGVIQGLLYGPIGAFIAEQFPTRVRYTGASLAYQGASVLGAGFTPMIATGLMIVGGLTLVAVFWITVLAAGVVAVLLTKESSRTALS